MGCHTWCYDRVFKLDEIIHDDIISETLKNIQLFNEFYSEFIEDKDYKLACKKSSIFFRRLKYFWDKGWFRKHKVKQKLLDIIASNTFEGLPYEYINGIAWKPIKGYGDNLFRVNGYPEDIMYSYEDTIKFLNKYYNENNIYKGEGKNKKLIKEFWEKYPNGMIKVG